MIFALARQLYGKYVPATFSMHISSTSLSCFVVWRYRWRRREEEAALTSTAEEDGAPEKVEQVRGDDRRRRGSSSPAPTPTTTKAAAAAEGRANPDATGNDDSNNDGTPATDNNRNAATAETPYFVIFYAKWCVRANTYEREAGGQAGSKERATDPSFRIQLASMASTHAPPSIYTIVSREEICDPFFCCRRRCCCFEYIIKQSHQHYICFNVTRLTSSTLNGSHYLEGGAY